MQGSPGQRPAEGAFSAAFTLNRRNVENRNRQVLSTALARDPAHRVAPCPDLSGASSGRRAVPRIKAASWVHRLSYKWRRMSSCWTFWDTYSRDAVMPASVRTSAKAARRSPAPVDERLCRRCTEPSAAFVPTDTGP